MAACTGCLVVIVAITYLLLALDSAVNRQISESSGYSAPTRVQFTSYSEYINRGKLIYLFSTEFPLSHCSTHEIVKNPLNLSARVKYSI